MSEKKTKKRDRSRNKKVLIVGPSVEINGKIYGASAMQTNYESSMTLPDKEKVQAICAEAYMKLLSLFTASPLRGLPKSVIEPVEETEFSPFDIPEEVVPETLEEEWVEEYNKEGIVIESNFSGIVRMFFSEENPESSSGIIAFDKQGRGYGDIEPYVPYKKI